MNRHQRRKANAPERPANLRLWLGNGQLYAFDARVAADAEVSIGRTDSKRALGFVVTNGEKQIDFVLDRDQVAELAAYIRFAALGGLRKPLGRKPNQMSLVSLNSPKRRLQMLLDSAATDAHPGWHRRKDNCYEQDEGAPVGTRLVAWFKKPHPRKAARIEREFAKGLWKGG
jgi:hypothetical protein